MNPKEFSWTEDQQVTVTNPTSENYKFKVHGKEYELGAGRTAKMPGFMAWVYVYGLASQLAQADGVFNRWNEEGFRQEYYERLVAGYDALVQTVEVEPQPVIETLDEPELDEPEEVDEPAPGTGVNYEPSVKPMTAQPKAKALRRGRSATV
jgi:hypothetical protein